MNIDEWFGLTYSNYLVIPRLMLESMPLEWQEKFVELLNEADDRLVIDHPDYTNDYLVKLRGKNGRFIADPYKNYRHGEPLKVVDKL